MPPVAHRLNAATPGLTDDESAGRISTIEIISPMRRTDTLISAIRRRHSISHLFIIRSIIIVPHTPAIFNMAAHCVNEMLGHFIKP